jgi:hypothetical protein
MVIMRFGMFCFGMGKGHKLNRKNFLEIKTQKKRRTPFEGFETAGSKSCVDVLM